MTRPGRILAALVLAAVSLWLAIAPATNPAVTISERFNRDVAQASAATYISLRAINAALSAAQEVEVGASLGVSGSVQPLKWLEPVDDTVERISEVIFVVAVVNGLLSLSVAPVAAIGFFLIALALLGRCGCEVSARGWPGAPPALRRAAEGCAVLGVGLAIVVPCSFALGSWAGEVLTAERWADANGTLDMVAAEARKLIGGAEGVDFGWRETASAYLAAGGVFWEQSDDLLSASLTIGGIFLLRLVLLPLVIFVALAYLARSLLVRP